jgi:hypothetical protein
VFVICKLAEQLWGKQIPRGLKAARDDKNKRLIGTTEEAEKSEAEHCRLKPAREEK